MKIRLVIGGFVLGVASALVTTQALSQDPAQMPSEEEMAEYFASMQPGKHHRMLDNSIGSWDTTTKMWWGGPGSPAVETEGTCERKWVLDGRFMVEHQMSDMMIPDMETGGMKKVPWEGMGMFGYDNNRNMFQGAWADSMGTHMLTMTGSASPDGSVFTYYGEMDEPMLGVVGRMVKYQTTIIDKDRQVFEIFDLHAGSDYKVIEVTYTRKK